MENNKITLIGTLVESVSYSHKITYTGKEDKEYINHVYKSTLGCARLSSVVDYIPLAFSEKAYSIYTELFKDQKHLGIIGEVRAVSQDAGLKVFVYVQEIFTPEEGVPDKNEFECIAYTCKAIERRKTLQGKYIANMALAVNRSYKQSDYIPAIAWGNTTRTAKMLKVGSKIYIKGRFQSRDYKKHYDETHCETKTTYEISIKELQKIE